MPKPRPKLLTRGESPMVAADVAQTQRAAFLEAYQTRRRPDSIFSLARALMIPRGVVIRWLQDPEFQRALKAADAWRLPIVLDVFAREMQGIMENLTEVAKERWPHSVRAALGVLQVMVGSQASGEHRLQAVSVDQLNIFAGKPTDDQITELLVARERANRIIQRLIEEEEEAHAEAPGGGGEGAKGKPRGGRPRRARGPGPVPPPGDPERA